MHFDLPQYAQLRLAMCKSTVSKKHISPHYMNDIDCYSIQNLHIAVEQVPNNGVHKWTKDPRSY
jgi:hypothetical protein